MDKKVKHPHIYSGVSKYDFEISKYVLPLINPAENLNEKPNSSESVSIKKPSDLEPFKYKIAPVVPSVCIWSFMSRSEILEIKEVKKTQKVIEIIDEKLSKFMVKGTPKKLLIELILSVVKFARKYFVDVEQTGAILSIFYNSHLYFTHNLWMSTEDIYFFFKEYVYFHSVSVPPNKVKIFEGKEAKQIVLFFCYVYLRNVPLIRLLMLPNYGLFLKIKNPISEEELEKQKNAGKKGKKKK